jgi:molybdopterin converting factor small subunit
MTTKAAKASKKIFMSVSVMIFGQLADWTGGNTVQVEGVTDTDSLVRVLQEKYPGLAKIKFTVAVDRKTVTANTPLHPGATVALMPPFSGG